MRLLDAKRYTKTIDKMNKNKRLLISFSGGETSAYMSHLLINSKNYEEIIVIFANTGQENEETLQFVDSCDKLFGLNVVWLEAKVFQGERKGTAYTVVDLDTASRDGGPFEEAIKKYGISNKANPFCTRELKLRPITKYVRDLGWKKGTYDTAIGIRFDEIDRMSSNFVENKIIYPLIENKVTKKEVREFWEKQPFRLQLHEHQGNCKWCWKKSKRKLLTLAVETPEIFEFPKKMENQYSGNGFKRDVDFRRVFFRGNTSTMELLEEAKLPFNKFVDGYRVTVENFNEDLDSAGACSESCEVF